jgi:prolyl-tRNA synthetase
MKAVLYEDREGKVVVAFVRGDRECVDQKVQATVGRALNPALPTAIQKAEIQAGFVGPKGLPLSKVTLVIDQDLQGGTELVTGANESDAHYFHFDLERDFLSALSPSERSQVLISPIAQVRAGDSCPECGSALQESRGIEIGNIFHLGTKYSASMKAHYLDAQGKQQAHVMGCYGIGVTRLLPSVIEEHHDDRGIRFPLAVAPMQIHLCAINLGEPSVRERAEKLYHDLQEAGIEVLYDDRDEKAGSQFADADLIGIPFRLLLSPKTLGAEGGEKVELALRDKSEPPSMIAYSEILSEVRTRIETERNRHAI